MLKSELYANIVKHNNCVGMNHFPTSKILLLRIFIHQANMVDNNKQNIQIKTIITANYFKVELLNITF